MFLADRLNVILGSEAEDIWVVFNPQGHPATTTIYNLNKGTIAIIDKV